MKELAIILHLVSRISFRIPRSVLRSRLGAARGEPLREFAGHALSTSLTFRTVSSQPRRLSRRARADARSRPRHEASVSQRPEFGEWQGFCQECGLTVLASRVPSNGSGQALYSVVRDAVKDVGDRIASGVDTYVDLGTRPA